MLILAAIMALSSAQAAEPELEADFTEQGRNELEQLLIRQDTLDRLDTPSALLERKPAVLGNATAEPSERREMYLDYSDSISVSPEESVSEEPQR